MDTCQVDGCKQKVSKPGHAFCLDHWKSERAGDVRKCPACQRWVDGNHRCASQNAFVGSASADRVSDDDEDSQFLSSTKIGKHFGLSATKVNLILAELGWIEKYVKGWTPTDRGNALGANVREMRNGTPFVVWPDAILKNTALLASIAEQTSSVGSAIADRLSKPSTETKRSATADPIKDDFRSKFPATLRTQDGHMVRSRAEVLIDNWLYMQGLVHAYERRLPIEEECYCDFYLPGGKGVYIEYWGLENDAKYRDRKAGDLRNMSCA